MGEKVIFLRKKIEGENSIEEFAKRVATATGATIKELPNHSTTIKGIFNNILFAYREKGIINHVASQSEAYLLPFLPHNIITYHDLGTIYKARNTLYKLLRVLFFIKPAEFFADAITFVSNETKEEFTNQAIRLPKKMTVIYNTYDDRLIRDNDLRKSELKVILQVGTGKRKNLESVILALKGIRNVKLYIVGKLSDNQTLLLKESEILYENHYDISYEEIVAAYNQATIITFPTFYEGFGLPVIEANVMGKPIISSDIPIIHEIGGEAVYYIDPNNISDIRNAIEQLLNNDGLYQKYVLLGEENSKRFSSKNIYPIWRELYNSIANTI